jgi:hypothetical protein
MNESKNFKSNTLNEKISNKNLINKKFITDKKFWVNRIKFDTPLFMIIFPIYFIILFINLFVLTGLDNYLNNYSYLWEILIILLSLFALILSIKVPKRLEELIIQNKNIFFSDEIYEKYLSLVKEKFYSKKEFYFPLIFALIFSTLLLYDVGISKNFEYTVYGSKTIYFSGTLRIIFIIAIMLSYVLWFISVLCLASALIIVISTFRCLNLLGTKKIPLKLNYKDLKKGFIDQVGKFVISFAIPGIFLITLLGIYGLIFIYIFNDYWGYLYIIIGFSVTILGGFLLYRNTINIHNAIVDYKTTKLMGILDEIEKISSLSPDEINAFQKYNTIQNLHEYYDRINNISDWPFNPVSIKKLTITFASSGLPLILSLFGLV